MRLIPETLQVHQSGLPRTNNQHATTYRNPRHVNSSRQQHTTHKYRSPTRQPNEHSTASTGTPSELQSLPGLSPLSVLSVVASRVAEELCHSISLSHYGMSSTVHSNLGSTLGTWPERAYFLICRMRDWVKRLRITATGSGQGNRCSINAAPTRYAKQRRGNWRPG